MDKRKNTLAEIRHTYAGPWPKALLAILFVIAGGHLISVTLFGTEFLSLAGLFGNLLVAVLLVVVGILVKRKYPSA
ncbi:hypothetical protein [Marinobacterium sp. BA1]|uniref:hypothetical protein n=1 Tax=Marinobacterium sp. BA1 TaxID=3138931 RepID=UPI0034E8606E